MKILIIMATLIIPATVNAVLLVQTNDPGFYNDSLGTTLNNTNGGNTPSGYFPTTNDSTVNFSVAPDLSVANSILGNWLTNPSNLSGAWGFEAPIPTSWAVGTEVAIIYEFNTLGAENVVASFGVDNGIFAWIDGNYIGGARRGGGVSLGEHVFNVGDLSAGTHYLQLLLEDHGGTNGYAVEITADSFIPAPVPVPAAIWLFSSGLIGLLSLQKIKRNFA